ncbi:MAG: hypothetical protein LBI99_02095 [Propionibacteriaceae bacterium]|jgi:hypothetical protein|nr:hypothetical protein [Propionibacteriaceae bacterium]
MRWQPVIRASIAWSLIASGLAIMAGCSPSAPQDVCPSEFTAAVIWSSPTSRNSAVQFFNGDQRVGEVHIRVQGLSVTDQTPLHNSGEVTTFATGSANYDQSNIVTISLPTCRVVLTRLDEDATFNLASLSDGYLSISNLNRASYLRKYATGVSGTASETAYEGDFITTAVADKEHVYAETANMQSGEVSIIIARSGDLTETGRIALPFVPLEETEESIVLSAGKLVLPISHNGDSEDTRLAVVDLATGSSHPIDLKSPSPFYVRAVGDTVYVAHTFMNPGFRPLSQYRHISVVNMADESVTGHDLQSGISRFDVSDHMMAVLGEDSDETSILHTYELPGFRPLVNMRLAPPASVPDAYAANVFLAES